VDTLGADVVATQSSGTGFTPGFASRLTLDDGRDVFVKAASSADDELHGWPLSDAYREEVRKLSQLPDGIGAPGLLWHHDVQLAGLRWIVMAFEYVDAVPPRRPWQPEQLRLVLDKLATTAPALTRIPMGLDLEPVEKHLMSGFAERMQQIRASTADQTQPMPQSKADRMQPMRETADQGWLDTVEHLCHEGSGLLTGQSIVHMDLRDDNVLIGSAGDVWFVDWNWPVLGAGWIDTICILLSARGDGLDVEAELSRHPLTRGTDPMAINTLLAVLWSFWGTAITQPVPQSSPHLRDHQSWYEEVTRGWLADRLENR